MYTSKWTQECSHTGPHPFSSVGVYFSDAIPIIVSCPFLDGVAHCGMSTPQPVVASPLIGVHLCQLIGELVNVCLQGCASGVFSHSQAHLPTLSTNRAQHRGAV